MKKLIKNGLIVDGTGKAGFTADLLIENDRIAKIGTLTDVAADEVIDASGLVVAPGLLIPTATAICRF